MTMWLWIIGICAVVWPVVLTVPFSRLLSEEAGAFKWTISDAVQTLQGKVAETEKLTFQLRELIEKQDELIASLWVKTYGHQEQEGGFAGDHYVSTTYDALTQSWGTCPPWRVNTDHVLFTETVLVRTVAYPWGGSPVLWKNP